MKKYLMTGVAALAICAAFTSCSKGEELYDQGAIDQGKAVSIVESYNQAFLKYIGANSAADIPANQTWGFGGYAAGTRGATPNANQWAQKYLVPDPLTEGQIERVTRYFQCHPNLGYKDPEWSNYFIQQVYKGGGSKRNDSKWCESENDEWYTSANGGTVVGSDHMDHLIAKSSTGATDHIFNFNNGTCSENHNVGDNGAALDTDQHTDRIQLMENSYTYTFTYGSSDASMVRERRCALVAASVIDEWGDANGVGSTVDDKWHRSFMGFDFEQRVDDEIFAKVGDNYVYAKYTCPAFEGYIWDGENTIQVAELNTTTWSWDYKAGYETLKYNNESIRILSSNQNMYCGDFKEETTDDNLKINRNGHICLNLPYIINTYLSKGYYPTNAELKKWVKPEGGADGYYSDWIVTLTKAEPVNQPDPDDVCIIAEDLSATDATDFDFNDVVFTVHYTSTTTATVTLYAAGGTLPLTVAGREVHSAFGYGTVDEKGLYKMINTNRPGADGVNGVAPVSFDVSNILKSNRGNDIEIMVDKGEKNANGVIEHHNWLRLTATGGQPAAKLCVGADFATKHKWCDERESIKTKYPVFSAWVLNNPTLIWWR